MPITPVRQSVAHQAKEKDISIREIADFETLPGRGVKGVYNGQTVYGGNAKLMEEIGVTVTEHPFLAAQGKTPLYFANASGKFLGAIAAADVLKEDSRESVEALKKLGLDVVMLTGDNEKTARAIAKEAGVDHVVSDVLPGDKAAVVQKYQSQGKKVAMVGDGINDAPALTAADMGIAIGAGTDVALDAADVVLMKSRLTDVSAAIRLSRKVLKNIRENLFWAFFYNVIGIPLAAGLFISLLGWEMNPMYGAAAMSLSSFFVVSNALRLNLVNIHDAKHDRPLKTPPAAPLMQWTVHLEGMMCGHCEATVKKALESVPGVREAQADHQAGTAIVTLHFEVQESQLIAAVEKEDYPVTSIEKHV